MTHTDHFAVDEQNRTKDNGHPEVVTFGETMALLRPFAGRGLETSALLDKSFGGAESNVAIGVARLGHRVGWFGQLGDDPFGRMIAKAIRGEGVDVSAAKLTDRAPTGIMMRETVGGRTSVYYNRRSSAASIMEPGDLNEDYIKRAKLLHVTGITAALSASCRETVFAAIDMAKAHGVPVCFDPNLRLKLWSIDEARPMLLEFAARADYFLPGYDELKLLFETEDWNAMLDRLAQLDAVSVVKSKGFENILVERGEATVIPFAPAERVVDTVGAGDGFCAGFIVGLLKRLGHAEAIRLAAAVGSLVVQTEGDWEALPTWAQLHGGHVER